MITIDPVDYLKSKGVQNLYHFTELSNLKNIIKYGLLSRDEMERRDLDFHDGAFANIISWRKRIGISNYVPFHLCPKVPMLYRTEGVKKKSEVNTDMVHIPRPLYILLDLRVLLEKRAILTDGHPTATNKYELKELDKINYDAISGNIMCMCTYGTPEFDELKRKKQAEILIKTQVETHYFEKIYFRSKGELKIARDNLKTSTIDQSIFELRPDFFTRRNTYLIDYTISNEYDITVELSSSNSYQSEKVEYYYTDGSKKETNCNKYLKKAIFQYDRTWGKPVSAIYYINDMEIFNIRF